MKNVQKSMSRLTQECLKELLYYEPNEGLFYWKKSSRNYSIGDVAGTKSKLSYIRICINSKIYLAHRLAFLYMEGYLPENDVDHIDRDPSNNKWSNLREVNRSCNLRNARIRKTNTSGITGVCYCKNCTIRPWKAQIKTSERNIVIGNFSTKLKAIKARWKAEVMYNFPNCNSTSSAYLFLKENNIL